MNPTWSGYMSNRITRGPVEQLGREHYSGVSEDRYAASVCTGVRYKDTDARAKSVNLQRLNGGPKTD